MNLAKYKLLLTAGVISLLASGAGGFFLYRAYTDYGKSKAELGRLKARYEELVRKATYPSEENRAILEKNIGAVSNFLETALNRFRAGQSIPEAVSASRFVSSMDEVRSRIAAEARQKMIGFTTNSPFGLPRDGKSFKTDDDRRRAVGQAKITEELCRLLFGAPITQLVDVQRTPFELLAPDASGAPAGLGSLEMGPAGTLLGQTVLPPADSNNFYRAERFAVIFNAHEDALWNVLGSLAGSDRLFAVVRHLELMNEAAGRRFASDAPAAGIDPAKMRREGSQDNKPLTLDERVVAGREPVRISMIVDIYRFAPAAKPEGQP